MTTNAKFLVNSANGIYIPQVFAQSYMNRGSIKNQVALSKSLAICLDGPDHEDYNEAWATVLDNAELINDVGEDFVLWQDCDLWAIPVNEINEISDY